MSAESIVAIVIAISAAAKAYFEWKKAQAERKRADNTEDMLKHTIKSVETAKSKMDDKTKTIFSANMRDYIATSEVDSEIIKSIVKEVTEGDGQITRHTIKLNRNKLKDQLNKQDPYSQ